MLTVVCVSVLLLLLSSEVTDVWLKLNLDVSSLPHSISTIHTYSSMLVLLYCQSLNSIY